MPKSLHSVEDHVADIVSARERATGGKFQAAAPGAERVADVIDAAGLEISKALSESEFKWSKTRRTLTRRTKHFSHEISFQGDAENTSGIHIGVSVHTCVRSKELGAWRETNAGRNYSGVWASQIGYLDGSFNYLKWQLLDKDRRQSEIDSIVSTIEVLALPAFEPFRFKGELVEHLLQLNQLARNPYNAIDIALWLGNVAAAKEFLNQYLRTKEHARKEFLGHYENELRKLSPIPPTDSPEQRLAWVLVRNGVELEDA